MLQKRRRSLLTLASYGTWDFDLTSFPYAYNSLLPNGSEVVKGKIAKIYANGVIENQLITNGDMIDGDTGWGTFMYGSTRSIENGYLKCEVPTGSSFGDVSHSNVTIVQNHKYLVTFYGYVSSSERIVIYLGSTSNNSGSISVDTTPKTYSFIMTTESSVSYQRFWFNIYATTYIKNIQLIDLTLMFGTGNEPTTLTDNRIQNLLNRGYIAYNTGEYKGTNVSEIETTGANLFNQQLEQGGIYGANGEESDVQHRCRTVDYVEIGVSSPLYFNCVSNTLNFYLVCFFDSNYNYISYYDLYNQTMPYQANVPSNAKYIRFSVAKRDNTNCTPSDFAGTNFYVGYINGNSTYKPSASIPFIYQGNGALNAHDTFEITSSEYVFTKNIGSVDLGTLTWYKADNHDGRWETTGLRSLIAKPSTAYIVANIVCSKYLTISAYRAYNDTLGVSIVTDGNVRIFDSSYSDATAFKTAMSGVMLYYELATPQVIRIPRKHLGIVDLGSLSWVKQGAGGNHSRFSCGNAISNPNTANNVIANIYCSRFLSDTIDHIYSHTQNNIIATASGTVQVWSSDYDNLDATQFKSAMQGQYLFYETTEEVDDIATRIFTENGGTVSALEPRLPREYQEVEYIESTGTQYIDTNLGLGIKVIVDIQFTQTNRGLMGYDGNGGNYWGVYNVEQVEIAQSKLNCDSNSRNTFEISFPNAGSYPTLTLENTTVTGNYETRTTSYTYKFFTISGYNAPSNAKLYSSQIYNTNNTLVRNFVPCYRKSDNVIGLYDLVGKQFYTNSGSGTFLKGSDVNTTDYCEVLPNLDLDLPVKV